MNFPHLQKDEIRKIVLAKRESMSADAVRTKSLSIKSLLASTDQYKEAEWIMTYINMRKEVETRYLVQQMLKEGKKVAVPVCIHNTRTLIASRILSLSELSPAQFGVMEPPRKFIRPVDQSLLDIIILPGLAFDKHGNRIGYGKGYYDNFLSCLPSASLKIALSYQFQIFDQIPVQPHDIPVDILITEHGIIVAKGVDH